MSVSVFDQVDVGLYGIEMSIRAENTLGIGAVWYKIAFKWMSSKGVNVGWKI